LQPGKVAVDLGSALVREVPRPRRVSQLQPFEMDDVA
jgi:hypothetical protein